MKYTIEQLTAAGYRVMDLYESIEMNPPGSGFSWEKDDLDPESSVGFMEQITAPSPTEAACWEEADLHHEIYDGLTPARLQDLMDSEVELGLNRATGQWSWDWSGMQDLSLCAQTYGSRQALLDRIDEYFATFA